MPKAIPLDHDNPHLPIHQMLDTLEELTPEPWAKAHLSAWQHPIGKEVSVQNLILAWTGYASTFRPPIGRDSELAEPFAVLGRQILKVLNREDLGRFDKGTLARLVHDIARIAEVQLDTEEPRAEFDGEALVFKHEDEDANGAIGPLWIRTGDGMKNYKDSEHINPITQAPSPQWFTLTQARGWAEYHQVPLEEV